VAGDLTETVKIQDSSSKADFTFFIRRSGEPDTVLHRDREDHEPHSSE
jgi:hypothetical protein